MANKLSKANFCEAVRLAIKALGASSEIARNRVNSDMGNLSKTKQGDDTTGDVKAKIYKLGSDKEDKATVNFKPGSETYSGKLTTPLQFSAWDSLVAKACKLCPTMTVTIDKDGQFGQWLINECTPKQKPEVKPETSATTPAVS